MDFILLLNERRRICESMQTDRSYHLTYHTPLIAIAHFFTNYPGVFSKVTYSLSVLGSETRKGDIGHIDREVTGPVNLVCRQIFTATHTVKHIWC